jgi:hypothetical protein
MAGFVTNQWAARLLEATAGKTAVSAGTVYLGLAWSVNEDPLTTTLQSLVTDGKEITTAGYARKAIPAFGSATTTAPVKITTPTAFSFNAFTADQVGEAWWAFLCDASSGAAAGTTLRYLFRLETPVLGRAGEPLNIPASTLIIE